MKLTPQNIERLIWLGAVLCLSLFLKNCGNEGDAKVKALQSRLDENVKQLANVGDSIANILRKHVEDSIDGRAKEQLQLIEKQEAGNKVKQQQKRIDELVKVVRGSNNISNNSTTSISVAQEYKRACDSLPAEIDKLNIALAEKDTAINGLIALMDYEINERDNTVSALRSQILKATGLLKEQTSIAERAINASKPRARLLGGIGVIGNETNPLSGTKINMAYQSRNGKQYMAGAMIMRGGVYYEATVLVPLIK